jgi:hypothetical protein
MVAFAVMVDMDQTLIEAVGDDTPARYKKSLGKIIKYTGYKKKKGIDVPMECTVKVAIRPNAIEMVRNIVANGHTYILWSAGSYEYVHSVMDYFSGIAQVKPEVIYTRLDMVMFEDNMYKSMTSRGFALNEFIILEDNPKLVLPKERNRVIRVEPWEYEDTQDTDMNWVCQLLQMYAFVQPAPTRRSVALIG